MHTQAEKNTDRGTTHTRTRVRKRTHTHTLTHTHTHAGTHTHTRTHARTHTQQFNEGILIQPILLTLFSSVWSARLFLCENRRKTQTCSNVDLRMYTYTQTCMHIDHVRAHIILMQLGLPVLYSCK